MEVVGLSDPGRAAGLSHERAFLALLDDERILSVRELRCLHAVTPRRAKEFYGGKIFSQLVQFSGGRATPHRI